VDLQTIALWICGFAVAAYVRAVQAELRAVKINLEQTQTVLNNFRELVPQRYATNEAMREIMRDVRETLQRIEDKLDKKVDK
jgi:hypothetical protein